MRSGQMTPLFQRVWLALGLALVLLLAGCGGAGTKYKEFLPSRILVIGDEITYLGCAQASVSAPCVATDLLDRFTINNVSNSPAAFVNNWVLQLANYYGLTSNQIVEPALQKTISSNPTASDALKRRYAKWGAKVADIRDQAFSAGSLPAYAAGDMLVLAGGMHDVLDILNDTTTPSDTCGVTLERSLSSTVMINEAKATDLPVGKACRIMQAAQQYQNLAFDLMAAGQRNIFVVQIGRAHV